MLGRQQLLMLATLPLYLGPLLAGLSGMGWEAVPVFAALFALWLVVMRPAQWPRDLAKWTSQVVVAAAAQVAVNVLIVVLLFAVGRGIGGLEGLHLNLSPLIPVSLSFLATPLSRLVWDPALAESRNGLARDAIHRVPHPGPVDGPAARDEMIETLLALPPDADPVLMADAIEVAMKPPAGAGRLAALVAALDPLDVDHRALREAVILWGTGDSMALQDGVRGAQESAFAIAGNDPVLLHLFAHRALDLILAKPGLWTQYPDAVEVTARIEASSPENLRVALTALAKAIDAASGAP